MIAMFTDTLLISTRAAIVGAPIAFMQAQREVLPNPLRKSMREGTKAIFASFFFLIMML